MNVEQIVFLSFYFHCKSKQVRCHSQNPTFAFHLKIFKASHPHRFTTHHRLRGEISDRFVA